MTNKSYQYLQQLTWETGMSMATMVQDKQRQFTYLTQCLQTFLTECGRTQAILAPTQFYNQTKRNTSCSIAEDNSENNWKQHHSETITSIQLTITRKHWEIPGNTLQSSENTHCTIEEQLQAQHHQHQSPIMPWVIRHAAYLLNRHAIHNDGKTSYFRRWNKEHKTPLCEFGETIQYMVAHTRRCQNSSQDSTKESG